MGESDPKYLTRKSYKISEAISSATWLEVTFDLSTAMAYILATWLTFDAML